jgi:hypothetical protein
VSRTRRTSTARTIVALASAGLLLSGCGSATPGLAAQVGDDEISASRVDEAAAHFCTALGDQFEEQGTTVPMGFVRQAVVQLLTLRAQAEQIADEYGVEPGSTYLNDVAQRQGTAATKPEEVREDYVDLASAQAYAQDILDQVGKIVLDDQGVDDATAEQISQAGVDVFNQWPDIHGVEIDPRYGLKSIDGVLTPVDTNTSVAVGKTAKSGLATEPDTAFAKSLPATHRCG